MNTPPDPTSRRERQTMNPADRDSSPPSLAPRGATADPPSNRSVWQRFVARVSAPFRVAPSWGMVGLLAILALLPLLSGLTVLPAQEVAHCDRVIATHTVPKMSRDTARTIAIHDTITARIDALSPEPRSHLATNAQALVRNCPYNRAAAGLPEIVQRVMEPHFALISNEDVAWTSPAVVARLAYLQRALIAHRRLLSAVGLEPLPIPQRGDYLYERPVWAQASLAVLRDSRAVLIAEARDRLDEIGALVGAYPEPTMALIDEANSVVRQHTDKRWPMDSELIAYRVTLIELSALGRAFGQNGREGVRGDMNALAADCDELTALLDRLLNQGC